MNWFLSLDFPTEEGKESPKKKRRQVINLGAGYDTMFYRFLEQGKMEGVSWWECDFPEVIEKFTFFFFLF